MERRFEKMEMEVCGSLLVVFLMGWYPPRSELSVFDWKRGQNIARLPDTDIISSFRFLSDKVIVVATKGSLDLFTLPEPQDNTGEMLITKVATLRLPFNGHSVEHISFCNPPAKNGNPRSKRQAGDTAVPTKPFANSPDNIIYCYVLVIDGEQFSSCSLVVHSSALLRYATPPAFNYIPWKEWSMITRCVGERVNYNYTNFSGQRWLLPRDNEVWDFNQYRVKRLGRDFEAETETAHISVVTEQSCTASIYLDVYSSLPYVRIKSKREGLLCIDDDRIFAATPDGKIEYLYFG
ncbi:hypothetical protein PILCRDRAFT_221771 [Piloderma croceum F 1598]|uniref:Uncharacterized protein n=1 Tax=Piloderma croceum (strain F 1598) TaxID=765440 RepID=A0A0C3GCA6_PILCF|nr:hypothetical protein PILCRDRAFT_221771 [Piloderma croceum F 1598]